MTDLAEEGHADGSALAANAGALGPGSAPANQSRNQAPEAQGKGETANGTETQHIPEQAGLTEEEQDKGIFLQESEQGRNSNTQMEQGIIASTPRTGPELAAPEAPPAEQLLPALMRQVIMTILQPHHIWMLCLTPALPISLRCW
jgi:hypothetical protein